MHCFGAFFTLKELFIFVKKTAVNPLRKKFSPFWGNFSVWGGGGDKKKNFHPPKSTCHH